MAVDKQEELGKMRLRLRRRTWYDTITRRTFYKTDDEEAVLFGPPIV